MQGNSRVGGIHRLTATPRLGIQRSARRDVRGHVGDRVMQDGTRRGAFEMQRLIEVGGTGWVDREEVDVAQIGERSGARIDGDVTRGGVRFGLRVRGVGVGKIE